jgi:hypothetical protein
MIESTRLNALHFWAGRQDAAFEVKKVTTWTLALFSSFGASGAFG